MFNLLKYFSKDSDGKNNLDEFYKQFVSDLYLNFSAEVPPMDFDGYTCEMINLPDGDLLMLIIYDDRYARSRDRDFHDTCNAMMTLKTKGLIVGITIDRECKHKFMNAYYQGKLNYYGSKLT